MSALRRIRHDPSLTLSYLRWINQRSVHVAATKLTTNSGSAAAQSQPPATDIPPSAGKTLSQLSTELNVVLKKPTKRGRNAVVGVDESTAPRNKLVAYLAHIESTKDTITLEDIEQYKHRKHPNISSSAYDRDYTVLIDVLTASFTVPQLKHFLELYGTAPPSKRRLTKRLYAEMIMEKWGWTALAKVQQDRIDQSEVSERQFPMEPGPSFLLMGKDGADLLSLAKRYNVHLSFTSNPLTLKVQGLKGSLKEVEGYLNIFKTDLDFEATYLPLGQRINPEIAQSISRASGAYVETETDGKLLVTYRKSQPYTAQIAKRLAVQTSMMGEDASTKAVCLPEGALSILSPSTRCLYPFLPTQTNGNNSSTGAVLEGLAHNSGTVVAHSSSIDIRTHLLAELAKVPFKASLLTITASAGHFLFLAAVSRPTSLVPPLTGTQEANTILEWIKRNPNDVFFSPSVPQSLMSSGTHDERQFRRVVYVAQTFDQDGSDQSSDTSNLRQALTLEVPEHRITGEVDALAHEQGIATAAVCRQSMEAGIDILIPDRPTDIRISATNSQALSSSEIPEELRILTGRTRKQVSIDEADVPLMLTYEGVPYILRSSDYVRQRRFPVPPRTSKGTFVVSEFLLETTIDPVTGKNVTISKLVCEDFETDIGWKNFLHDCDSLTSTLRGDRESPSQGILSWEK